MSDQLQHITNSIQSKRSGNPNNHQPNDKKYRFFLIFLQDLIKHQLGEKKTITMIGCGFHVVFVAKICGRVVTKEQSNDSELLTLLWVSISLSISIQLVAYYMVCDKKFLYRHEIIKKSNLPT